MRVFVLVEPKFFTPPEIFPTLLEGFAAWRDANREHMESFEFFAGGGGGFGIFNVPDEATLSGIMVQYPFFPYSKITVRPILDGDTALRQWREIMSEGMDAGPAVQVSHQESINYLRNWPGLYGVSASWLLALIHERRGRGVLRSSHRGSGGGIMLQGRKVKVLES